MDDQVYYTNLNEPYTISLDRDENGIFLIRALAHPVEEGYVMGSVRFRVRGEICELYNIETAEAFRGQGVGHTLLCLAEGIASTLGAKMVDIEIAPMGVGRRFLNIYFTKHGYEDLSRKNNTMRKDLIKHPVDTFSRK